MRGECRGGKGHEPFTQMLGAPERQARFSEKREQAVAIRQISGAVNGLQFRVQDLDRRGWTSAGAEAVFSSAHPGNRCA